MRIRFSRGKTGIPGDLPIMPELAGEIGRLPSGHLTLLTQSGGQPYKPETLGNWFRDQCNAAGLPKCADSGMARLVQGRA